jgi:hypothetical protein
MGRSLFTALWLLAWFATPGFGQTAAIPDTADVLVVDHDFGAPGERVPLFLQARQVYRAELSSEDATLVIRAKTRGIPQARVYPVSNALSPSGGSVFEIYPDRDGEYEILPVGLQGSRLSTRLRIYRDVRESRRRVATANKPGWELGIEVAGGWHSAFVQSSAASPPASGTDLGSDLEACLTARNAPGAPRLNLCVLGVSHQSQHAASNILWVYTEPRLRLFGRARPGLSNWELGPLFRFGVGMISGVSETPIVLGPGFYVARHIRKDPDGSGWSLQVSYFHAFYRGFDTPTGASSGSGPQSNRLSFGVGWYQ